MTDSLSSLSWAPSPWQTHVEVSGPSRIRFLQGLFSNDVQALEVGQGTEGFFPTVQGKILAHCLVLKEEDRVLILGLGDQTEGLLPHLQKYAMIEDVEIQNRQPEVGGILVWGSKLPEFLAGLAAPELSHPLSHGNATYQGVPVSLFRTPLFGFVSVELRGPSDLLPSLAHQLQGMEGTEEGLEVVERFRIENRFPRHGKDLTAEHLAQEANRDDAAISFRKGCYLGQETVARIDALGHVNKKLVPLRIEGVLQGLSLPYPIEKDGKQVGQVTSLASTDNQGVGLGMLRREVNQPGTRLEVPWGTIEVLA